MSSFLDLLLFFIKSKESGIPEGEEGTATRLGIATDDVIDQLDLEERSRLAHGRCHAPVCLTRGWITARVIVHQNNPVGCRNDGRPEDLARVSSGLVYRSHRNDVIRLHFQFRIQKHGNQMLFVRLKGRVCCNDILPKYEGIFWGVKGSPSSAILRQRRLSDSSQDHFQGVRRRRIVIHNNFSLKRAPPERERPPKSRRVKADRREQKQRKMLEGTPGGGRIFPLLESLYAVSPAGIERSATAREAGGNPEPAG